jgi:hypothetical protein
MIHYRALFEDLVNPAKEATVIDRKPVVAADRADFDRETIRMRRG